MSSDGGGLVALLALGPASATALYWTLFRYYRNTDKSHAFERETAVAAKPVTGNDRKLHTVTGTEQKRITAEQISSPRMTTFVVPHRTTYLCACGLVTMSPIATGAVITPAFSGEYPRMNWKYCTIKNVDPNITK